MKMFTSIPNPFIKTTILLLVVICSSIYVFGIDGTNGASKKSTSVFSSIKTELKLSLNSGFHYIGSKNLSVQRSSTSIMTNSIVMYQKRNITWVVPQKTKVSVFNRFKTPSPTNH